MEVDSGLVQALQAASFHPQPVAELISNGLINTTYKVTVKDSDEKLLLQKINTQVFPEPSKLADNYNLVWAHLDHQSSAPGNDCPVYIPAPRDFTDGTPLFRDRYRNYWRLFEFIDNATTLPAPSDPAQAKAVARIFAAVTHCFADYDIDQLHIIIPGFHDLSLRYAQFRKALHTRHYDRLQKAAPVVEQIRKRERYVSFYEVVTGSGEFRRRLMHHDAKIANILFDEKTGAPICPVDLDTCMPGYYFSDLGDMLRSMVTGTSEEQEQADSTEIRKNYYDQIVSGYLEILAPVFTEAEKNYIHYAGPLVIYMQALRFITDYLEGDHYYRTTYPQQNFDRAVNQLNLLEKMEDFLATHYSFNRP